MDKGRNPTVFYGTGKAAQYILEAFPGYPVIGLLDGYKVEGEVYGKPVLSLDMLSGQDVSILLLARKASEKVIYQRISGFCDEYLRLTRGRLEDGLSQAAMQMLGSLEDCLNTGGIALENFDEFTNRSIQVRL